MHRKVIAPVAAALIVVITAAVAWMVRSTMAGDARTAAFAAAQRAREQFKDALQTRGYSYMGAAQSFAASTDVAGVFKIDAATNPTGLRQAGYPAVQGEEATLQERYGRAPELVMILDKDRKVIVRNEDQYFNHQGDDLEAKEPSTRTAIENAYAGQVDFDVWNFEGKMTLAAVMPVWGLTPTAPPAGSPANTPATLQRTVIGTVVIGYDLSKEQAESDAKLFNASVAYFLDGKVQSNYFLSRGNEDPDSANALVAGCGAGVLAGKVGADPFACDGLGGEDYVGIAAPLPGHAKEAGAVLLVDVSPALGTANRAAEGIVLLGALALIVLLGALFLSARSFLQGVDDIETGLDMMISGSTEHMFKTASRDLEGTANALNVVLARLIPGRPEGDEDEEQGAGSRLAQVSVDDVDQTAVSQAQGGQTATDAETLRLAQEPEQDYFKRLFAEYNAARKTTGQDASEQTFESFVAKLRLSEGSLKKKYNCRSVRFRVLTRDGQVTLKPVPIF